MCQLFIIQPELYLSCAEHIGCIIQNTDTVLNDLICLLILWNSANLFFHARVH